MSKHVRYDDHQCTYIDLPGETVQCYRTHDHLKVVLKKHRDVIFNITAKTGATYSLESDTSDFYYPKVKALYSRNRPVTFKDGERFHIWIGREFVGNLILKQGSKVIAKYDLRKLDPTAYSKDPKEKPMPFIIKVDKQTALPQVESNWFITPRSQFTNNSIDYRTMLRTSSALPQLETYYQPHEKQEYKVVQVVEFKEFKDKIKNLGQVPSHVLKYFEKGGGKDTGLAEPDPFDVMTRNWLYGQLAGIGAYIGDNWEWLRHSIETKTAQGTKFVKMKFTKVGNNLRVYFIGYSKNNPFYHQGGFGLGNERAILPITAGAGSLGTAFKGSLKAMTGTVKGNAVVAMIFSTATALAEWHSDAAKDGYDATAAIFMGIAKALLVAVATAAIMIGIIALSIFIGGGIIGIFAIGVITIIVGFVFSYLADVSDKWLGRQTGDKKNEDGLAKPIADGLRKFSKWLGKEWDYLAEKMNDYYEANYTYGEHHAL